MIFLTGEQMDDSIVTGGQIVAEQIDIEEYLKALLSVIEPIRENNRPYLRQIAEQLKQLDGERWAVGEMLERACIFLDAAHGPNNAS